MQINDRFSAELLKREPGLTNIFSLCSSIFLLASILSQSNALTEFCTKVLHTFGNISIKDPSPSELDEWQSRRGFTEAFGRFLDDEALRFDCENISYSEMETPRPPDGQCLEKIGNGAYITVVPHTDGSNCVFVSNQQGKIWLTTVPDEDTKGNLGIVESEPFLDLSDKVVFNMGLGLVGMAFHPHFMQNDRFFLSFSCDKMKQPGCIGRCLCNTDVDCDPSNLGYGNGITPCQYYTIIVEYTVNDTASKPSPFCIHNLWDLVHISWKFATAPCFIVKQEQLLYEKSWLYVFCTRMFKFRISSLIFCMDIGSCICRVRRENALSKAKPKPLLSTTVTTVQPAAPTICDRFSAELLKEREPGLTNMFSMCSFIFWFTSILSQGNALSEFCTKVSETCGNISIKNPSPSELDQWQSRRGSAEALGRSLDDEALRFNCENTSYSEMETPHLPDGLCLEKIGNGAYITMVPHPDGSNRVFVSNQQGMIWLATVPDDKSNGILGIVESKPFLDLTDKVAYNTGLGLLGMAFHPHFMQNGRFFLSFNCDKMKQPGCIGRCLCNTDVDCDPSKLGNDKGIAPCQYHTIIAEYTVNDTSSKPTLSKNANAAEVRRILTMGLPYSGGHAGQILFGPADGYMYLMIRDCRERDDPYNFAQNKKSFLGKILRVDTDHIPSAMEINELGLWGNYSIPKDNPYVVDKELGPEIWALGFKNPWRCSFDSERPSYFICGDSGQDRYEEVDIITKGGNYGWRVYEGPLVFHPGNSSSTSINPIFPVMGYYHSEIDTNVGSASIVGGYFYRSMTDPCLYGRYLYMDLYAGAIWAGSENPENSGNFTTTGIPFRCAHKSPIQCTFQARSPLPDLGFVFSFAEDNKKDVHILTSTDKRKEYCSVISGFLFLCSFGEMGGVLAIIFLFGNLLLLPESSFSLPLCTDSRPPFTLNTTLSFCPYDGKTCCNSTEDLQLQNQLKDMNISNSGCASLMKSILCAKCDQFSAELFTLKSVPRPVPLLCNSTASDSSQSREAITDFCTEVWDTCQNVSILNSPFSPSLQGQAGAKVNSNFTKLTDFWQSKADFCNAFGGKPTNESVCFDGEPVTLNDTGTPSPPKGLCLEKIANGSYLNMVAHPDGSNRAFFSNQAGKIWLATIPEQGSGGTMGLDVSNPFVDLTDEVHLDTEFGMMGMAFHPNFAKNGRFFASFNCDKVKWPGCAGRCSCNSDVNCDPSKLGVDNGAQPCQYQTVIAEYTANGTASEPSLAKTAKPLEVRRVFTMGLPFTGHHGGQILFGPNDGYLYFMMGDGGGTGDPYNFSQNKKSLLGKIMRLDVDNVPSPSEIEKLGFWGNYSIPKDNPFREDEELQPEIWAVGLRNPWRSSFDSERPSYFMCADVGQDLYEEVNIITRGGNYGWRLYEGPYTYTPPATPGGTTPLNSVIPIPPVLGYNHSEVNKIEGSASITGGYFYRSTTDPCMYGRYLYADLYATALWAANENPENSGNFTTNKIPFSCAHDSPTRCNSLQGSDLPSLGYIFSFGEDNRKDIFILASEGVYRVVRPSRCNYTCSKETAVPASPTPSTTPSFANHLSDTYNNLAVLFSALLFLLVSLL
ncbi:hypothetical protein Ddye_002488 [Dipteronia dyeriana]|uniref:Glucose/Sorbosone dehydrogenase domain-containing protein n=1 Tax=Dipteronia dyeriana TaxID=168575 RepID=A0AAD9XQG9_9ROSI|nr:hypothetical protein Ddye_002488 [Dipteronia dyeriana]